MHSSDKENRFLCAQCWYEVVLPGPYMADFDVSKFYEKHCDVCQSNWAQVANTMIDVYQSETPVDKLSGYLCRSHAVNILKDMHVNKLSIEKYDGDEILCQDDSGCKERAVFYVHP